MAKSARTATEAFDCCSHRGFEYAIVVKKREKWHVVSVEELHAAGPHAWVKAIRVL
ncbi:MAG: hypothetical protein AB1566_15535 [Chloroflexota bacterium]